MHLALGMLVGFALLGLVQDVANVDIVRGSHDLFASATGQLVVHAESPLMQHRLRSNSPVQPQKHNRAPRQLIPEESATSETKSDNEEATEVEDDDMSSKRWVPVLPFIDENSNGFAKHAAMSEGLNTEEEDVTDDHDARSEQLSELELVEQRTILASGEQHDGDGDDEEEPNDVGEFNTQVFNTSTQATGNPSQSMPRQQANDNDEGKIRTTPPAASAAYVEKDEFNFASSNQDEWSLEHAVAALANEQDSAGSGSNLDAPQVDSQQTDTDFAPANKKLFKQTYNSVETFDNDDGDVDNDDNEYEPDDDSIKDTNNGFASASESVNDHADQANGVTLGVDDDVEGLDVQPSSQEEGAAIDQDGRVDRDCEQEGTNCSPPTNAESEYGASMDPKAHAQSIIDLESDGGADADTVSVWAISIDSKGM
jgi:hypothetical protein